MHYVPFKVYQCPLIFCWNGLRNSGSWENTGIHSRWNFAPLKNGVGNPEMVYSQLFHRQIDEWIFIHNWCPRPLTTTALATMQRVVNNEQVDKWWMSIKHRGSNHRGDLSTNHIAQRDLSAADFQTFLLADGRGHHEGLKLSCFVKLL